MGVKGLFQIMSRVSPQAMTWIPLGRLHGLNLAVDASTYLMRFLTQPQNKRIHSRSNTLLHESRRGAHVLGLYSFASQLLSVGVRPLFVFDYFGASRSSSKYKRWTSEKRLDIQNKQLASLSAQLHELNLMSQIVESLERLYDSPWKQDVVARLQTVLFTPEPDPTSQFISQSIRLSSDPHEAEFPSLTLRQLPMESQDPMIGTRLLIDSI
jgi:hypothetical protein